SSMTMRTATRSRVGTGAARASALTGDAVPRSSLSKRLNAANAPPQVTSRRVGSTHRKQLGRNKSLQLDSSDALARIEASSLSGVAPSRPCLRIFAASFRRARTAADRYRASKPLPLVRITSSVVDEPTEDGDFFATKTEDE